MVLIPMAESTISRVTWWIGGRRRWRIATWRKRCASKISMEITRLKKSVSRYV